MGCFVVYTKLHAADAVQLFAVGSHGLNQVLHGHVKFLLKSDSYWDEVCEWSADLWYSKNCLRELLADDSTHLADGLHTADQVHLHRHCKLPPKNEFVLFICYPFVGFCKS